MSVLKKLWDCLRRIRAEKSFRKARCIRGNNVELGPYAHCGTIGQDGSVTIGSHVFLDCSIFTMGSGRVTIGDNCWIGGEGTTAIGALDSVTVGNNAIISNHVHIYDNNNHPTDPAARIAMTEGEHGGGLWRWIHSVCAPVVIEDNVWIGEFSMVLKGVTVGEGSVVAAHSVVTKDVPPYSIVAGNPARVVKSLR